jgi:hypothetical protein
MIMKNFLWSLFLMIIGAVVTLGASVSIFGLIAEVRQWDTINPMALACFIGRMGINIVSVVIGVVIVCLGIASFFDVIKKGQWRLWRIRDIVDGARLAQGTFLKALEEQAPAAYQEARIFSMPELYSEDGKECVYICQSTDGEVTGTAYVPKKRSRPFRVLVYVHIKPIGGKSLRYRFEDCLP